jgi:hypothetical protein
MPLRWRAALSHLGGEASSRLSARLLSLSLSLYISNTPLVSHFRNSKLSVCLITTHCLSLSRSLSLALSPCTLTPQHVLQLLARFASSRRTLATPRNLVSDCLSCGFLSSSRVLWPFAKLSVQTIWCVVARSSHAITHTTHTLFQPMSLVSFSLFSLFSLSLSLSHTHTHTHTHTTHTQHLHTHMPSPLLIIIILSFSPSTLS